MSGTTYGVSAPTYGAAAAVVRTTATEPAPTVTVGNEMANIDQELGELHAVCEALEKRLEPVLAMAAPAGDAAEKELVGLSPVCAHLRGQRRAIVSASGRLRRLLDRAEV